MIKDDKIIIKKSILRTILLFLGAVGFIVAGIWMIITDNQASWGLIAILFFGLCALFILRMLFCNKPALIVDEHGITDNSSAIAIGFIPWKDIETFTLMNVTTETFIKVEVKNIEEYLNKVSSFKRKVIKTNIALGHGAVLINLNTTEVKPKNVIKDMQKLFDKYKKEGK